VRIFRHGDEGPEVLDIQQRLLELGYDVPTDERSGSFAHGTDDAVRAFQRDRNLRVDGLVGSDTWGQLVEAGFRLGDRTLYLHAPYQRGDDVRALQRKLDALGFDPGKQDGVYGPTTDRAVRDFQRNVGEEPDGVVGLHMIATLDRMRPLEDVPGRTLVREGEELRALRGTLDGQIIAVDPGHGPTEGARDIHLALARSLAAALAGLGAKPEVLRGDDENPSPSDRAAAANDLQAGACVSLHLGDGTPEASGPTCSYFGSQTTYSPLGRRLAELILDELEHELGVRGRLQRLTTAMLRETQMPAVQVEALVATNELEAAILRQPGTISRIGRAIAEGVRRFVED
jgi:N-acetylmuramoyl-L-alanine amidase